MAGTPLAIIGCGYVGSALAKALAGAGHDVVATTTSADRLDEICSLGAHAELLDIADVDRLGTILADRQAVYLTIAPKERGADYRDVYLAAARSLAKAVRPTPVRRIIYTSSTRVYGQDDGGWVDETSPTKPRDEQGNILVETEETLLETKSECRDALAVSVVRLGGIHGPERDLVERAKTMAGTQRSGGDVFANLIHRDDIVTALSRLLDVAHQGALNLCDDKPEPRRAIYDRIIAQAGLDPIRWMDGSGSDGLGKRVRNDRIKNLLGLALAHPVH